LEERYEQEERARREAAANAQIEAKEAARREKEQQKEAQQKQAELEMAAAQVANEGLVATMCSKPSAFSTPPLSPCDGFSRHRQNGSLGHKF